MRYLLVISIQMNRLLVLALLAVFCNTSVKAQRFKVGALAGVNITDVDGMDPYDFDNDFHKFGFTVGGFVAAHLGEKALVQMEIAYSQKGSSFPPDTSQMNFNNNLYYTFRLNYLDVDFAFRRMIRVNMKKGPTNKFGIEGGLSFGYMYHYYYSVQSVQYSLALNNTDIAVFAGFCYNFTPGFCIDLRYYNSLVPVIPSNSGNSSYQLLYYDNWNRGRNLGFQITFKYTFGESSPTSGADNNPPPAAPAKADDGN